MSIYTQYPDLTELGFAYDLNKRNVDDIKTEFLFYLQGPCSGNMALIKGLDFTEVSCMNNWWPSHRGENRKLTLWWKRGPKDHKPQALLSRHNWTYSGGGKTKWSLIEAHLGGSGCGMMIGEPPLKVSLYHRFFTLMRMPVTTSPIQKRWLTRNNFRLLDEGKIASYWVNGWKPAEYDVKKEYEYFKTTKQEWLEHGMDGY